MRCLFIVFYLAFRVNFTNHSRKLVKFNLYSNDNNMMDRILRFYVLAVSVTITLSPHSMPATVSGKDTTCRSVLLLAFPQQRPDQRPAQASLT